MGIRTQNAARTAMVRSTSNDSHTNQICESLPTITAQDIRELRKAYGLTQEGFAKKFGIPVSTLRKWEQGVNAPSTAVSSLLRISTSHELAHVEVA